MLNYNKELFWLCVFLPIILCVCRIVFSFQTWFILPDEKLYYMTAQNYFQTGNFALYYSDRVIFQLMVLLAMFPIQPHTLLTYTLVMPAFSMLCSLGCIYMVQLILTERKIANQYAVMTLCLTSVFLGMSTLILTESLSLLALLIGIYFTEKSLTPKYALISTIAFSFATLLRLPLAVFLLGNTAYIFIKTHNITTRLVASIIPLCALFLATVQYLNLVPAEHNIFPMPASPLIPHIEITILHALIGTVVGLGATSILMVAGFYYASKNNQKFLMLQCTLSAVAFLGSIYAQIPAIPFYYTLQGFGTSARYSYTLLPAILVVPYVYEKYGCKLLFFVATATVLSLAVIPFIIQTKV